jgi:hypothetical protein
MNPQSGKSVMFDLTIEFGRPDDLAAFGEALGRAGISVEGGGLFTVDGRPIAHFLVADGLTAQRVLGDAGITVTAVREVLTRRLDQAAPGQLGAITRAIAEAGASVEVLYSDHDHQLILLTSNQAAAAAATRAWDKQPSGR